MSLPRFVAACAVTTIDGNAAAMLADGRRIFRYDTFGSEAFWTGKLRLNQAIVGVRFGGVGNGLTPATAHKEKATKITKSTKGNPSCPLCPLWLNLRVLRG